MTGRKFIATVAAVLAVGIAMVGFYLYRQGHFAPPSIEQGPVAGEGLAPDVEPAKPQAAAPAEQPSKPPAEATGALTPPSKPTAVPSFDVVLVEPNGEGVIAGRAEPGWQVSVQSGGTKVAEATADEQGEWSVVLEKPLSPGDHALSLKTTSPDGTRALTSQQSVPIAVGKQDEKKVASVPVTEKSAQSAEQKGSAPATSEAAPKEVPDAVKPVPQAEPPKPAQAEADQQAAAKVETKPDETTQAAPKVEPSAAPAAQPKADQPAEAPPAATDTETAQEQASKQVAPSQPAPQMAEADDAPATAALPTPAPAAQAPESESKAMQPAPGGNSLVQPQAAPSGSSGEPPSHEPPKPLIVFKTVDYEDTGSDTGKVKITGTSEPGATIHFYFDEEPLAKALADREGKWSVEVDKKLGTGQHAFRAERYDDATGMLAGRAMVSIERVKPAPEVAAKEPEVAAKEAPPAAVAQPTPAPSEAKPSEAAPSPAPSPQVAAVETGKEQAASPRNAQRKKAKPKVYIVRRGDTLWDIARRYLGGGWRYTSIYRDNRKQIRDPDEILPNQKVKLPKS